MTAKNRITISRDGLERGQAGEDDEGRKAAKDRKDHQRQAEPHWPGTLAGIDRPQQAGLIFREQTALLPVRDGQFVVVQRDRHSAS